MASFQEDFVTETVAAISLSMSVTEYMSAAFLLMKQRKLKPKDMLIKQNMAVLAEVTSHPWGQEHPLLWNSVRQALEVLERAYYHPGMCTRRRLTLS